jgi:hypothetical protein
MMPKIVGNLMPQKLYICGEVEEETGSAGEQPVRNRLRIYNIKERGCLKKTASFSLILVSFMS